MFGEQHQLAPRFGLGQGFDVWQPKSGDAGNINRKLLAWLPTVGDRRFLVYLHYLELHWPYCPPKDLRGTLDEGPSTLNLCRDWRQLRDDIRSGARVLSPADRQLMRARYDEELVGVDRQIGALMAELKARGVYDRTLVVVTADHGEEFAEHGGWFHGQSLYEELVHVPLLVKPPRSWEAPAGRAVDGLTELRNISATFLDAAGVQPLPPRTVSLLPWLRGEGSAEGPNRHVVSDMQDRVAVRTERWKLVAWKGKTPRFELYDLAADPGERRDVATVKRRELASMRQLLAGWRQGLRPTHRREVPLDSETREGLKSLGYVR
jgi:arylsulfatase A-like enzyme